MKSLVTILVSLAAILVPAWGANPKVQAILPQSFAGWVETAPAQISSNPGDADKVYSDLLREYGFQDLEPATYARDDRKISVKAMRFRDASGAYGAFTFYKTPEMQTETIGDQGASANERVLFYRGNVLVRAVLDRVTAMSAAELRELADDIALPAGSARNLPSLPLYLPKPGYVANSAKYAEGPLGLERMAAPVPAEVVDFPRGAEVAQGQYSTGNGIATLTLISYPTPQIAAERLRAIEAARPAAAAVFLPKRSGPLVAIVTGTVSASEAKSLLASVNYDAAVTWNQNTFLGKRDNVGTLLVGVVALTGIILGLAVVAGIAFGGIRILAKRFFPDRIFDRSQDVEIISLKLGG
jgi:hypothetical protein